MTVLVGSSEKKFTFPRVLLTRRSAFFKAALNGEFKEAKEKTVCLPEVEIEAFATYAQWIYANEIALVGSDEDDKTDAYLDCEAMELYILADLLGDALLQNCIIDECIRCMMDTGTGFSARSVSLAYESLLETCPMRKLIIRVFALTQDTKFYKQYVDALRALLRHRLCME